VSAPQYAAAIREIAELKTHEELRDHIAHAAQGVYSAANQLREKPLDHKNQSRLFDKIIAFTNILNAWFVKEGFAAEAVARKKEAAAEQTLDELRKAAAEREEMEADRIEIIAAAMGEGKPDFSEIIRQLNATPANNREEIQDRAAAKRQHIADLRQRMAEADRIVAEAEEEVAAEVP
jgi:hypothetical protein